MENDIKVALLEQKYEDLTKIISRIENVIQTLSEVNTNVTKMLAVHEEKINYQEEKESLIFSKLDKLSEKVDRDYENLVSRMQTIEKRVWMAIGAIACITFIINNTQVIEILTPQDTSTIMEQRNFKV
jgi:chaperonin cofactor prefoldin